MHLGKCLKESAHKPLNERVAMGNERVLSRNGRVAAGNGRVLARNGRVATQNEQVLAQNERVEMEILTPPLSIRKCVAKRSTPIRLGFELWEDGLVASLDTNWRGVQPRERASSGVKRWEVLINLWK